MLRLTVISRELFDPGNAYASVCCRFRIRFNSNCAMISHRFVRFLSRSMRAGTLATLATTTSGSMMCECGGRRECRLFVADADGVRLQPSSASFANPDWYEVVIVVVSDGNVGMIVFCVLTIVFFSCSLA